MNPKRPQTKEVAPVPLAASPSAIEAFGPAAILQPSNPPAAAPEGPRIASTPPIDVAQPAQTRPAPSRTSLAPVASIMPSSPPVGDALARLAGDWNNEATGENASIRRSTFGWEIWLSNLGQASIVLASRRGANIEVSSRDVTCLYVATIVAGGKMNWQLREGPEGKCLAGLFSPASIAPQ